MTAPTVVDEPVTSTTAEDHECHWVCCDDDVAMCGADVTDDEWCDRDHEPTCVTCRAVDQCGLPCPVEGCHPVASAGGAP